MTLDEAKDYLYATLKVLTKNTDEEIRAYIELLETGQNKMSIAELEKIKEKIQNIPNDETTRPVGTYDYCVGAENERRINLEIIDNHISELKGEDYDESEKEYSVWMEGYACTGNSAPHQFIGKVKAKDFKTACYKAVKEWCSNEEDFEKYYDAERCSFWGCRCYDNVNDASFYG